jgi:hypothetical protein
MPTREPRPEKPEASGKPEPPARLPLSRTKPPREWRSQGTEKAPRRKRGPAAAAEAAAPVIEVGPEARPAPQVPVPTPPPAYAAPAPAPQPPAPDTGPELPARYGLDRLVLLVRDPFWTYVWWELTEQRLQTGRGALGAHGELVLRFYDVSALEWDGRNHHGSFDIEVHDAAGNWYVELGKPGASYIAELGVRAADGRFVALVRSNTVTLPRDGMSSVVDEEWMVLEEDYRRLFELAGGEAIGLGSGEILRWLEERLRRELLAGAISSFGVSSLAVPSLSMQRKP